MPNQDITDKQEAFCQAYSRCWNGQTAALMAGYSEKSAVSTADKLLADPAIRDRIFQLGQQRHTEGPATKIVKRRLEKLLHYLTEEASVCDYLVWDGIISRVGDNLGQMVLKPSWALTPEERVALRKISLKETKHGVSVAVELKDPGHVSTALDYLSLGGDAVEEFCQSLLGEPGALSHIPDVPRLVGEVGDE